MENHRYVTSQRGIKILLLNNFIYNFEKNEKDKTKWRCQNRSCNATVYLINDQRFEYGKSHNHHASIEKSERLVVLESLKSRAVTCHARTREIVTRETCKLNESTIVELPKLKSLSNLVRKEINKKFGGFDVKISDIPDFLRKNLRNENFLRYDS